MIPPKDTMACAHSEPGPLLERFEVEMAQLIEMPPVAFDMSPAGWYFLLGQLQLALRHPENTGPTSEKTRAFCMRLIHELPLGYGTREIAHMGFDPQHDV
jgi:hypothetical protein